MVPPPEFGDQPILVQALQSYSPGQVRSTDVWLISAPDCYSKYLQRQTECDTFADVQRILARVFYQGDDTKVNLL